MLKLLMVFALVLGACGGNDSSDDADSGDSDAGSDAATTAPDDGAETTEGGDDGSASEEDCEPTDQPEASDDSEKPVVVVPDGPAPVELEIDDLIVGDGDTATAGSDITVHYVGVLHCGGTQFDASWDRGQPFDFRLGMGQVITGWDAGVEGMQVGGRRMLSIPSEQAYGAQGSSSGSIGPDAALVFVVDLLAVTPPAEPIEAPEVEVPTEPATEILIEDLVEGDGAEAVAGANISVHYIGVAQSSGEVFDSSFDRGEPVTFPIGVGQLIPGWDEGIPGMKVGGQRRLVLPPDLAYGPGGSGPIGPNETLVFVVQLIDVEG